MKKTIRLYMGMLLAVTVAACSREEWNGNTVEAVPLRVEITAGTKTRGETDELPTRYVMEIYDDKECVDRTVSDRPIIEVMLPPGKKYDLHFWADGGGYDAGDLTCVKAPEGSGKEAFAGSLKGFVLTEEGGRAGVTLRRAVACIRLEDTGGAASRAVKVMYASDELKDAYDVIQGKAVQTKEVTGWLKHELKVAADGTAEDYLLASDEGDILTVTVDDKIVEGVKVKKNYVTQIAGELY